jgi:hypothetical protein
MGFEVPLMDWFRGLPRAEVLRVLKGDTLATPAVLEVEALAPMSDDHLSGQRRGSGMIWALLMANPLLLG